ncbi:hypothetical protein SDJN02_18890, partial [Cucurbita argyrosperma subsp. argyrosperma]
MDASLLPSNGKSSSSRGYKQSSLKSNRGLCLVDRAAELWIPQPLSLSHQSYLKLMGLWLAYLRRFINYWVGSDVDGRPTI